MQFFSGVLLVDLIGIILALFAVIYAYFQWMFQFWKKRNVPYFEPRFPLGNRYYFKKGVSVSDDLSECIQRAKQRGWKYFGFYLAGKPFFVPLDLEVLKCVLTKDFNHFTDRGFYYNEEDDPLSGHLFSIGGNKWRNLRAKLSPTFTSGKMRGMFQILVDCSKSLETALEEQVGKEPIDIKHFLVCFSTDVIGSCAFGLDCNSFKESDSPFLKYGRKCFTAAPWLQLIAFFENTFPKLAKALHMKVFPSDISNFYFDIVTKAVNYREMNNYSRNDFLQILIDMKINKEDKAAGNRDEAMGLTLEEIVAQCFVFFLGGFETSSTTNTFVLFELSRHPEIQEKVRRELFEVLEKYDGKICYDALKELEYMQQVIDETLRKYPPIPFVTRECVEDYRIPQTDVILEKGTAVMISSQSIHYDEDIYENPDEFDPERFTPENKQGRHQYTYLPFGEGPRMCIGMRFGIMQIKVGLATILKNFRVTLDPRTKIPLEMDPDTFVPTVKTGIWLNLEKV